MLECDTGVSQEQITAASILDAGATLPFEAAAAPAAAAGSYGRLMLFRGLALVRLSPPSVPRAGTGSSQPVSVSPACVRGLQVSTVSHVLYSWLIEYSVWIKLL